MQDRERRGDINKQGRGIGRERVNIQMLVVGNERRTPFKFK